MLIVRESQSRWLDRLQAQIQGQRVPLSASIELQWRCNFHCHHCYLGDLRADPAQLDLAQVQDLFAALAAAGCLSLVITGGEPTLHPDFDAIYVAAVRQGFFVSLFTNASQIDEARADLLAANPPHHVEVSLYGASAKTYARVTGLGQGFAQTLRGIDLLNQRGVNLRLKAVLLRDLFDDVEAIRALAQQRGLPLTFDPVVDGDFSGNTKPWSQRVDVETAVALEYATPERRQKLCLYDAQQGPAARQQNLSCGAAQTAVHIDPQGFLQPCVMLREPRFDLRTLGFAQAWAQLEVAAPVRHHDKSPCATCEVQHLCNYCPGVAAHVGGSQEHARTYYCSVARARAAHSASVID